MSLRTVAGTYAVDLHRTRAVWLATALFVLVFAFADWTQGQSYDGSVAPLASNDLTVAAGVMVPLTAVALGHGAVAGARESGALRVLLAYPHSLREVVAGALPRPAWRRRRPGPRRTGWGRRRLRRPGREAPRPDVPPVLRVRPAVNRVRRVAGGGGLGAGPDRSPGRRGSLGAYLPFFFAGDWLPTQVVRWTLSRAQRYPGPEWVRVVNLLDPASGFTDATEVLCYQPRDPLAFYETAQSLAAVFVCWTVVPVALALWRFPRADLRPVRSGVRLHSKALFSGFAETGKKAVFAASALNGPTPVDHSGCTDESF